MARALMEPASNSGTLTAETAASVSQFHELRDEWNHLFDRAHNPAPTLHYDWLANWLAVSGPRCMKRDDALMAICFRRKGQLVGVLPMYVQQARRLADGGAQLRFLSTGEDEADEICPDYMDLLCTEDVREQCAKLAMEMICGELSRRYDRLELTDISDVSPLVKEARAHSASMNLEVMPRGVCPIADLQGGFDAYLARLSANTRQQCRRLLRGALQAGAEFEVAHSREQGREFFQELITLHQRRWQSEGKAGCFSSRSFTEFHQSLIEQWIDGGIALVSRLRLGTTTLAVKYGFRVRDKFDFYQSGVRVGECGVKSPGIVSFLMLMRHLAGEGVTAFDFLRGASDYKQRLATTVQPVVGIRRIRWTWKTTVGFIADVGRRGTRKAWRMAMSHSARAQGECAGEV